MSITYIALILTVCCAIASCQALPQAAFANIMKEVLTQGTPEQAIQINKGVAPKKIGIPEFTVKRRSVIQEAGTPRTAQVPFPVNRRPAIMETGVPRAVIRNEGSQKTVVIQKSNEMGLPRNVVVKQVKEIATPGKVVMQNPKELTKNIVIQKGTPNKMIVKNINELATPMKVVGSEVVPTNKIIVKKPELAMPNKVLVKNPEVVNRKILVQKGKEIPMLKNLVLAGNAGTPNNLGQKTILIKKNNMSPQTRTISDVKVVPEVVLKQPRVVEIVSQEKVLSVNPFLPAASPVSPLTAIVSTSNAAPQPRGQYLRKIPIPPPTI